MTVQDDREPAPVLPVAEPTGPWLRLNVWLIWVDLAQSVLSLLPAVIAIWVVGVDPGTGQLWPLIGIAGVGVFGAVTDTLRWNFTRYRISPSHVELKTGVLLRKHRSIQRDRIRSVDTEAKLRHRIVGLRVVAIGAGQQNADGDSALRLDAVSIADAKALQQLLLHSTKEPCSEQATPDTTVFARFEPRWVVYNMFNAWAYVLALGLGWGGYWLLGGFGIDAAALASDLFGGDGGNRFWTVAVAFAALTLVGVTGLAVTYFTEYWNFELTRVPGENGTLLRTRQGLFTTREVNRDDNRIRGVQISEPVLWRWLGVSDTTVVTTGLSLWALSQPSAILPRGPVTVARRVAGEVLNTPHSPLEATLRPHPRTALRRRLWWATNLTAVVAVTLLWLASTGVLPFSALWAAAALWPCALLSAVVSYRSLGHTITGPYLVARSGLLSRATTVLQRSAVSTVVIRESPLQRRLGLKTVSVMTAAGNGGYDIPDLHATDALPFADQAAPGLLSPFLTPLPEPRELPDDERTDN